MKPTAQLLAIGASLMATSTAPAHVGSLIINEYNAVGDAEFLPLVVAEPYKGYDTFFGRVQGNGGNWIELVVAPTNPLTTVDIRGWSLQWQNDELPLGPSPLDDSGSFTFNNNPLWSNVRAGTIITVREDDFNYGAMATDVSFIPDTGDFWININVDDLTYVDQAGFKVDNDNWQGTIKDASNATIQGPIGEAIPGWGGGGINNQEVGKLEANPANGVTNLFYDDGDYSTFGGPNTWNDTTSSQNFSALRTWWTNRTPGDADLDGDVDLSDLSALATFYSQAGTQYWANGNFDGDGDVDLNDLSTLAGNYGSGQAQAFADFQAITGVPEPTSLALLAIGLSVTVRRTKRTKMDA